MIPKTGREVGFDNVHEAISHMFDVERVANT